MDLTLQAELAKNALVDALNDVEEALGKELSARRALESARNTVVVANADDPKALGANEATRNAKIAELTSVENNDVVVAENHTRALKHILTLAQLDWEYCKQCIRIAEVLKV